MDDKGNIKNFENEADAKKEGFRHPLTPTEAKTLSAEPENERLVSYICSKYQTEILNDRRIDTMEKLKIKSVIRFCLGKMTKN